MSTITRKAVCAGLTGGLLAATAAAGMLAVAASPASASARACQPLNSIEHVGGWVLGSRFLYCVPPDVENPRPVTIQRRVNATTWINVTSTGNGTVSYRCVGTSTHTYRLLEATTVQVTAPCG